MIEYLLSTTKSKLDDLLGKTIVLAISGGVDSIALLDLVANLQHELQLKVIIAHVEHGLRGAESRADARFVQTRAEQYGFEFRMTELGLEQVLADNKKVSLQELARQKRYKWLVEVCVEYRSDWLLTGHHRDDNVETIMMRLITGTSSTGLSGMQFISERWGIKIMRPLLLFTKQELQQYCEEKNVSWREDLSNQQNKYLRNKIRNQLLPLINAQYNPRFDEALLQLAELAAAEDDYLELLTRLDYNKIVQKVDAEPFWELQRDAWLLLHSAIQRRIILKILHRVSKRDNVRVSKKNIDLLIAWLHELDAGGKMQLPNNIIATREANKVVFSRGDLAVRSLQPITLNVGQVNELSDGSSLFLRVFDDMFSAQKYIEKAQLHYNKHYILVDYDIIAEKQIIVRARISGDRIRIMGMQGNKSVKKLLIEEKVARHKRELVPLVLVEDQIVWVVGIRQSEFAKCSKFSNKILCIIYYEEAEGGLTDEE